MKLKELLQNWLDKYAKLTLKERSYNEYVDVIRLHINPIYAGKIAFGRRKKTKVKGTKDQYCMKSMDDYILSEGNIQILSH